MFYLTKHSTHFIYGYMASDIIMVKDHSDRERGNPLPPHGLLFPISNKGSFYMHHPTDRIVHTTAFVTPVVEHWPERLDIRCRSVVEHPLMAYWVAGSITRGGPNELFLVPDSSLQTMP